MTVRFIGMAPIAFVVNRQADEDRLVRDVAMSPTSSRLQEVVVNARRRGGGNDRPKGRAVSKQALEQAQTILTPEQWAKVPERIKAPGGARRGRGNGGP